MGSGTHVSVLRPFDYTALITSWSTFITYHEAAHALHARARIFPYGAPHRHLSWRTFGYALLMRDGR